MNKWMLLMALSLPVTTSFAAENYCKKTTSSANFKAAEKEEWDALAEGTQGTTYQYEAGIGLSEFDQYRLYPYVDQGYQLSERGEHAEAIRYWEKGLQVSPQNRIIINELHAALLCIHAFEQAEALLLREQETQQNIDVINALWADLLVATLGQEKQHFVPIAQAYYQDETKENSARYRVLRADLQRLMDTHDNAEMQALYEKYLVLDDTDAYLHASYAYFLINNEEYQEVEALLETVPLKDSALALAIRKALIQATLSGQDQAIALQHLAILDAQEEIDDIEIEQWAELLNKKGQPHNAQQLLQRLPLSFDTQVRLIVSTLKEKQYDAAQKHINDAIPLIQNAEDERQLLILAAELVSANTHMITQFYAYQPIYKQNHAIWFEKSINLAQQEEDYQEVERLLLTKSKLTKNEKHLLAYNYLQQDKHAQAIETYRMAHDYYPHDMGLLLTYVNALEVVEADNISDVLVSAHPFKQTSRKNDAELHQKMLMQFDTLPMPELKSNLIKVDLYQVDLAGAAGELSAENKSLLGELHLKLGNCQTAASLFTAPLSAQQLQGLSYCYEDSDAVIAYEYLLAASEQEDDTAIIKQQAYLAQKQGEHNRAYQHWLMVMSGDREQVIAQDYLAAAQSALVMEDTEQSSAWLMDYKMVSGPENLAYWEAHAVLAQQQGDDEAQLKSLVAAQAESPSGKRAVQIAILGGNVDQAEQALRAALVESPDDGDLSLQLAYILVANEKEEEAIYYFQNSLKEMPDNYSVYLQLSQLYRQQGERDKAKYWAQKAAENKDYYIIAETEEATIAEQKYNVNSYNEQVHRDYTVRVEGWKGVNNVPAFVPVTVNQDKYANYWNAEIETGPGMFSTQWGEFGFYGRLFGQNSSPERLIGPGGVELLGVGVKYQPFAQYAFTLFAEPQYLFEREEAELQLRATTAFLSSGEYSSAWHVEGDGWTQQELYFDAVYWTVSGDHSLLAKYTLGQHFKLDSSLYRAWTLQPYFLAQAKDDSIGFDGRVGAALALNFWNGGETNRAYSQRHSVEIQVDRALKTYLQDDVGVSLLVKLSW